MAAKKKTFEESMQRLEEIVSQLEKGEAPLEESLSLFEEGMRLATDCGKQLDQAEQAVMRLVKGAEGAPEEVPMEVEG